MIEDGRAHAAETKIWIDSAAVQTRVTTGHEDEADGLAGLDIGYSDLDQNIERGATHWQPRHRCQECFPAAKRAFGVRVLAHGFTIRFPQGLESR